MTDQQKSNIRINAMKRKIVEIMIESDGATAAEFMVAVHTVLLDLIKRQVLAEYKDAS